MKAFVLAGGLGTRLRARFGDLPKALAPLGGRPFVLRQLQWLECHGVRDVVLCAGYGGERLKEALGDGAALKVNVSYSIEPEPLGTGGALRHARPFVDGPALVLNGDTLLSCDPWAVERTRWEAGAVGAVALYSVPDASGRGRVECEADGRVRRFIEKDPGFQGPAWVSGGLYAFSPALWRLLPEGASSLEFDVLPGLAAAGRLRGSRCPGEFFDIGTPEEWERAERRFAS
jgi:NDP-sugar pyrophosphorylase family protein